MLNLVGKVFLKLIGGTRNERIVRGLMKYVVEEINPLEESMRSLSDEQMRAKRAEFQARLAKGESRESIKAEAFALVREASRRARNHRQFDVQLAAGLILDRGWIVEEATGEGKTIACYPAIYMAVLEGMKAHLVTTNDYLVRVGADFARPIFELLGVSVGFITTDMGTWGREAAERKAAYGCDVVYGSNNEFGFDYLRDNMKTSVADQAQRTLDYAIVDEVDSILIDEARTPLIISGPAYGQTDRFRRADAVAREILRRNRDWDRANQRVVTLKREIKALGGESSKAKAERQAEIEKKLQDRQRELEAADAELAGKTKHYEVELDKKAVHITHEGVTAAQEVAGVGSFYSGSNIEWPHLLEQALRAHLVFDRDKDYIVREGAVIIVDEFTGRLMEGRQWSDGLHQAVEAKEGVTVKEETQTMATVTLQNFFRMYKKLAGMTGTAMTEANEFMKIYKLDVSAVPTHRPVNRVDHEDRIYAEVDAKYDAIIEEINEVSKRGRPVLVGTTSIEKSEKISELLKRRYGVEHQVLNGRIENASVEGEIVKNAGEQRPLKKGSDQMVGMVTIATNMAGRGTDIKLGPGVVYGNCKVPPAEKLLEMGLKIDPLYPPGTNKCCIHCKQYDPVSNCAACFKPKIDSAFPLRGRTDCRKVVPCGLHVVGTERHEARRIDNQLRGRSGRQGDPGSSRFFLSVRDDLMAVFAGEWTLKVLGWLGLAGDVAIEDRRISRGIENAQKKVEERNFEMRKNVLEYDEIMDRQRRFFYGLRQQILEGRETESIIRNMLDDSVEAAVEQYLDGKYAQRCIAEWARQKLQIPIRDDQVRVSGPDGLVELEQHLREMAKEEAVNVVSMELGEYMGEDLDPKEWDLKSLGSWAMSRFGVNLTQNQLRKMSPQEVEAELAKAAGERIDQIDLSEVARYLQPDLAQDALAEWARSKFAIEVTREDVTGDSASVMARLTEKVEASYRRREIEYPVEYALQITVASAGTENIYAVNALAEWVRRKYGVQIPPEEIQGSKLKDLRDRLLKLSESWHDGQELEQTIRHAVGDHPAADKAAEFAKERFDTIIRPEDLDGNVTETLLEVGRKFLRREMTELERFVLLQIYDASWKDHLLAMDHLRGGIGLRGYAEQDPRVAYKREGGRMFEEMIDAARAKVTDMIFKVRLEAGEQMASVYQVSHVVHEQLSGYDRFTQDMQQVYDGRQQKVETIRRDVPRVGRNDPCPCGSGKKYKKCCGIGQ